MRTLAILILLGTLSVSCRSLEHVSEQCSLYMVFDDRGDLVQSASVCFCRKYKFSEHYVGAISGTEEDRPLSYCNKTVGFKNYAETATFWEKVRREIAEGEGLTGKAPESVLPSSGER